MSELRQDDLAREILRRVEAGPFVRRLHSSLSMSIRLTGNRAHRVG